MVVVLIIGILAAVAVPQYQKAVYKARFTQARIVSDSIVKAEESFYLANNRYTNNVDKLDLSFNPTSVSGYKSYSPWGEVRLIVEERVSTVDTYIYHRGTKILEYDVRLQNSSNEANRKSCIAWTPDNASILAQVCQNETGRKQGTCGSYCSYDY